MKSTAHLHNKIAHSIPDETDYFFYNSAALDAAVDMLNAHSTPGHLPIGSFLLRCKLLSTRFLYGHDSFHPIEGKSLEAQILQKMAARWQRIWSSIGDFLVVHLSLGRVTQKDDAQSFIDQEHVFDGMLLFLAAVIELLITRVLGARDASLGTIMTKRGEPPSGGVVCCELS